MAEVGEVEVPVVDRVLQICDSFTMFAKDRDDTNLRNRVERICANLVRDTERLVVELGERGAESPAILLNMLARVTGELLALYLMFEHDIVWFNPRLKEKVRSTVDKLVSTVIEELDKKYIWYCSCVEEQEHSEPRSEPEK